MSKLTKAERSWIDGVQKALNAPGGNRLGFFTTGDHVVTVYDLKKQQQITDYLDRRNVGDFCQGVSQADAELGELRFPNQVESTAG